MGEMANEVAQEVAQGNRVRELRENKLMTQAQLARKAKVALRTIHSVEKGMNCRMDTKRKILLALGLRFEDKDLVFPSRTRIDLHAPHQPHDLGSVARPRSASRSHRAIAGLYRSFGLRRLYIAPPHPVVSFGRGEVVLGPRCRGQAPSVERPRSRSEGLGHPSEILARVT